MPKKKRHVSAVIAVGLSARKDAKEDTQVAWDTEDWMSAAVRSNSINVRKALGKSSWLHRCLVLYHIDCRQVPFEENNFFHRCIQEGDEKEWQTRRRRRAYGGCDHMIMLGLSRRA